MRHGTTSFGGRDIVELAARTRKARKESSSAERGFAMISGTGRVVGVFGSSGAFGADLFPASLFDLRALLNKLASDGLL
jgi:hypothetical protein